MNKFLLKIQENKKQVEELNKIVHDPKMEIQEKKKQQKQNTQKPNQTNPEEILEKQNLVKHQP